MVCPKVPPPQTVCRGKGIMRKCYTRISRKVGGCRCLRDKRLVRACRPGYLMRLIYKKCTKGKSCDRRLAHKCIKPRCPPGATLSKVSTECPKGKMCPRNLKPTCESIGGLPLFCPPGSKKLCFEDECHCVVPGEPDPFGRQ